MVKLRKIIASSILMIAMMGSTTALASEGNATMKLDRLPNNMVEKSHVKDLFNLKAPAPPLTGIYVTNVISPQGGNEAMTSLEQYSTAKDHGGDWLQVITFELGYGSGNIGKFNNGMMTKTDSEPVDLDGDSVIDGFYYLWTKDSSFTSGQFTTQSTSTNAPWNTMSTFINIK